MRQKLSIWFKKNYHWYFRIPRKILIHFDRSQVHFRNIFQKYFRKNEILRQKLTIWLKKELCSMFSNSSRNFSPISRRITLICKLLLKMCRYSQSIKFWGKLGIPQKKNQRYFEILREISTYFDVSWAQVRKFLSKSTYYWMQFWGENQ